jgi:hypothetical protein
MEESISGFKQEGGWVTIVAHGERITAALRDIGVSGEDIEEWDEWRPKTHERLGDDITEKTAEQASITEGEGEQSDVTPNEDLDTAGEELTEAVNEVTDGDLGDAVSESKDSAAHAARAVDSAGRKMVRATEETIYKHVMTQVSPCYFDNELMSANLSRVRDDDQQRYAFEVNVTDDDLRDQVSEQLALYDDEIDHWRVETKTNTDPLEVVEGTPSLE